MRTTQEIAAELDEVSLDYRVKMTPSEAASFCKGVHDGFLGNLIKEIDAVIPVSSYSEGYKNPNHGKQHHWYYIGRENSRVLYVQVVRAYLKSGKEAARVRREIQRLGRKYEADEVNGKENGEVRIWWD